MTIGERLRARRLDIGKTQNEIAKALKTTRQTVYKYEQSVVTNIPLSRISELAKALDTTVEYILDWDTKKLAPDTEDELDIRIFKEIKKLSPERRQEAMNHILYLQHLETEDN